MISGILSPIYEGLGYVIRFCYNTIGFQNYALALFWFALLVKIVMIPFAIMQQKSQIKGAKLRPKMLAIEKKYAGRTDQVTIRKKQQEILEMQQREGYSPLSGCLPLLIQLPVIFILYNIIQRPLSYICMLSSDTVKSLAEKFSLNANQEIQILSKIGADWSSYPELADVIYPNFNLFGVMDLSSKPADAILSLMVLIPILVFASQYFTMKLSRWLNPMMQMQAQTPEMAMSNKIMDFVMPAMTCFLAFTLPGALGLYWFYQSLISVVQMLILAKLMPLPTFTPEQLKDAERELKGKAPKYATYDSNTPAIPRPRSLHYIDDEDEDTTSPVQNPGNRQNGTQGSGLINHAPVKKDQRNHPSGKNNKK